MLLDLLGNQLIAAQIRIGVPFPLFGYVSSLEGTYLIVTGRCSSEDAVLLVKFPGRDCMGPKGSVTLQIIPKFWRIEIRGFNYRGLRPANGRPVRFINDASNNTEGGEVVWRVMPTTEARTPLKASMKVSCGEGWLCTTWGHSPLAWKHQRHHHQDRPWHWRCHLGRIDLRWHQQEEALCE